MCTYNGCFASFDEQERGSLEVGKAADMVVLSQNPYAVDPSDISSIRVEQLLLGGKPYESCKESVLKTVRRGLVSKAKF